jgi:hypothetical protein
VGKQPGVRRAPQGSAISFRFDLHQKLDIVRDKPEEREFGLLRLSEFAPQSPLSTDLSQWSLISRRQVDTPYAEPESRSKHLVEAYPDVRWVDNPPESPVRH